MGYWKPFAGSVIDLKDKYVSDIFFRTQTNIIALQVLFVLCIFAFVWFALAHAEQNIRSSILAGLTDILNSDAKITGDIVKSSIQNTTTRGFMGIVSIIMGITAAFGFFVAHITLAPARNALEAQKRFISNIAHELRTPLSIIKTNIEVSLLEPSFDTELQATLTDSLEELDRITNIIDNLLSFNSFFRLERIEFTNVDLGEVIDRTHSKFEEFLDRKNIDFTIQKSEYRTVWGNESALEQVTMNVLKNAIVYTQDGGHITVSVRPDYRGNIEMIIRDSGIGIARNDLFHIFEPFYRAERSRKRNAGESSGMGLAIVNEIVKLHRGKILIKSAPKKGTAVIILFPCGKPQDHGEPSIGLDEVSMDFSKKDATK